MIHEIIMEIQDVDFHKYGLEGCREVIRCKDCKHKYIKNDVWTCPFGLPSGPDGYCSYGERKEE